MAVVVKGVEPKTLNLDDGAYEGKIRIGEVRPATKGDKKFSYYDLYIVFKDKAGEEIELKVGYSLGENNTISPNYALGKLIKRFTGAEVEPDKDYDLSSIFDGKPCRFLVMKNQDTGFFDVAKDSVKPLGEEPKVEKVVHAGS